ncbi:MAG: chain length determinant protein tyrosine kinase EpsG [Methylophilaceae bacterium]|nr:chain length determinant protein tyrosine kinase EpsG [Methylophilaceae bacterium]
MNSTLTSQVKEVASNQRNIGHALLDNGKVSVEDVENILKLQHEQGLRFGDAAIKLGLVNNSDILQALAQQFDHAWLPANSEAVAPELVAAIQPDSPVVESLRLLRSQLTLRWFSKHKSIVITSPSEGQGASHIAANLAVMFAQLGQRTLLIDADLRNPRQHTMFRLPSNPGLSDILAGRANIQVIHLVDALKNLFVLTAGTIPPNPLELLSRPVMPEFLNNMANQFDVIIIDSPPALSCADAQTLSAWIGGTVVVTRRHHTKLADVDAVKQQLTIAGAELVGAVLNDY